MKSILLLSVGLVCVGCSSSHTKTSVGPDGAAVVRSEDDDDDEETIAVSALPANIIAAVEAAVPGITITEAEVEDDGYCVHGTAADGEFVEVEVDADGKVGEIEYGDDDDEDDDEDDDDDDDEDDD